jgi:hypothetical protein
MFNSKGRQKKRAKGMEGSLRSSGQVDKRHIVKAEGNFEDLPYFSVGNTRRGDGVIEYRNEIRSGDGQVLKQTWVVRALSGLGLPGTLDQDVYVALLQIIERQGAVPDDGWLSFSLYEMVNLLNRSHGGRDYQQVKVSLDRLAGTRIQSKNAFYRKSSESFVTDTFSLLDHVQHSEVSDSNGGKADRTRVKLSDYFVESYNSDYLKGLDVDFYYSLNSAVAKRLYRFIDKKRNHRHRWEVELFALRDRIPLSNYKYPSKIKEKLAPAHDELMEKGFLESVRYSDTKKKAPAVCYKIQDGFSQRRPAVRLERTPENQIALERLKTEGVWGSVAEELVANYGAERCLRYAEALPFQKKVRRRGPWLKWAIQQAPDLDPPEKAAKPDSDINLHNTPQSQPSLGFTVDGGEAGFDSEVPVLDPIASSLWEELVSEFGAISGDEASGSWFDGVVATSFQDGTLDLVAPNEFARQYIEDRFLSRLSEIAAGRPGNRFSLSLRFS